MKLIYHVLLFFERKLLLTCISASLALPSSSCLSMRSTLRVASSLAPSDLKSSSCRDSS